jgi:hypothetical protein
VNLAVSRTAHKTDAYAMLHALLTSWGDEPAAIAAFMALLALP